MVEKKGIYTAVDVDGTLVKSNISYLFGKYLYKKKLLSPFSALWMAGLYFLHRIGLVSVRSLHTNIFASLFRNKSKKFFIDQARECFLGAEFLFRKSVLEDVLKRQERGEKVVLLSASPDFLVSIIAEIVSLPEWHGTEYLVDEKGNFSSLGRIMTGGEKAELVKDACRDSCARVVAMTDSREDMPLLLLADERVLVHPSWFLRRGSWKEIV